MRVRLAVLVGTPPGQAVTRPLQRDRETRGGVQVYRPTPGSEPTARITGTLMSPEEAMAHPVRLFVRAMEPAWQGGYRVKDESGAFDIGPFPPGTYSLEVAGEALPRHDLGTHVLRADETLRLGSIPLEAQVPLAFEVSRPDGRTIMSLRSRLVDGAGRVWRTSFSGGLLEAEPLPAGRYELTVHAPELRVHRRTFDLVAGMRTVLSIGLEPGIPVVFRCAIPEGVGAPPGRALLAIERENGEGVAELDVYAPRLFGTGEPCGLSPGSYRVGATAGALAGSAAFTVAEGARATVEVRIAMR